MTRAHVNLWWLPVGAGGHVVIHTSRWWESMVAHREHRSPHPLFHAALEVFDGESRYTIEMAPAWGHPASFHGVVCRGPVGSALLGASRFFQYEARCWRDGIIPDLQWAPAPPTRLRLSPAAARDLVVHAGVAPRLIWGRDPFGIGDMWNSNSLVAWLLHTSDIDTTLLGPPGDGLAPGWRCGAVAAERLGPDWMSSSPITSRLTVHRRRK